MHADQGEVCRVSDHGGEAAGCQSSSGAFGEGDFLPRGIRASFQGVCEGVEEAQAGGCVDGLSKQAGREAGVEVEEFARGDDLFCDA